MTGTELTAVIFRKFKDNGEIIALFPYDPASTDNPGLCTCYVHVGQHGQADPQTVIDQTRPARPAEYAALKRELESPPYEYRFRVLQRTPPDAYAVRAAELRRPRS